ncbi:DUF2950 domain-containing protein [Dyella terrae]|uniref:DUF2950 domain-containing protein n=3 Tax=Rhodanobacteraceae TaxID=1775411 RepID=A0A4R0YWI2_9GAMM|nr:DUF2950 domain-containing protein [Dyella terrae]TCI13833.1 DUF2950 domain-containing protein [Dyella soli]
MRSSITRSLLPTLVVAALAMAGSVLAQEAFPSADKAAEAFVQAIKSHDEKALSNLLGADWKTFIPTEGIDQEDLDTFLSRYNESHRIVGDDKASHLEVGKDTWSLPIPLVKKADGWHFDVKGGKDEILARRIGANELAVMQGMLAYYDAQREYATLATKFVGLPVYAEKLISSPGKHDGLYWPDKDGEPESPLGPEFASHKQGEGFNGYQFHVLTAQGASAPGGAYNYVVGGKMRNGFALVGYPSQYGRTGVMTFMVSHDGEIFEKDLGKDSAKIATAMTKFDPDSSWKEVTPDQ